MDTRDYWQLFIETGAPEIYLMYASRNRAEDAYVFNGQSDRAQSDRP